MKNKGFSLVELIVVIAIMAILVGVAVPVYTSYIDKANKSKDEQLVDEIKHAIQIAAVGDEWYKTMPNGGVVGTVVITKDGTTVNDEDAANKLLETALTRTFGDLADVELSWDGWKGSLSGTNLTNITGSNYYGNTDSLLSNIQILTNAVKNVPGLDQMVGENFNDYLSELASKGYDVSDNQAIANAAVLYVADRTTDAIDDPAFAGAFETSWKQGAGAIIQNHSEQLGLFGALAAAFARVDATVTACHCGDAECVAAGACSHGKCINVRAEIADYSDPSSDKYIGHGITRPADALTKFNPLVATLDAHVANCPVCGPYFNSYATSADSSYDANAYIALLGQVTDSEDAILPELNNEGMYASDTVLGLVDEYVSVANVLKQLQDSGQLVDGAVVITVTLDKNGNMTVVAYPMDLAK